MYKHAHTQLGEMWRSRRCGVREESGDEAQIQGEGTRWPLTFGGCHCSPPWGEGWGPSVD